MSLFYEIAESICVREIKAILFSKTVRIVQCNIVFPLVIDL